MLRMMARARSWLAGGLALAGAAAGPAHAEWLRAETTHFVIYGDTSQGEITRYAQKLERFDALLRTYYPIHVENEIPKLDIVLANGNRDMDRMAPGIGSSVAGFYSPDSGRIFAVVNTRSELDDVVIYHEYAHHFMFQMTSVAYPSWFVEGFAEYYDTADVRPGKLEIGRFNPGRINSLTQSVNEWAPMEDVLRWTISRSGRYRAFDYYAQAWGLTHYMLSDPERTRKLGQYLNQIKMGADPIVALRAVFDLTPIQLQENLRRYLRGAIPVLSPQIQLPDAPVVVTALPRSYDTLVWYDFRLDRDPYKPAEAAEDATDEDRRRVERANREAAEEQRLLIANALADAERFPGDRLALLVKSRAQRLEGQPSQAFDTLAPLLRETSDDAVALRLAGLELLDQTKAQPDPAARTAMLRQTMSYLSRALDADPLDFRTYLALDDARQGAPGYPNANDLSTLEIASTLAPQSSDARVRTARAYLAHGKPALAVVMLTPVANDPHGGAGRKAIRDLLAQARAAAGMPAAADGGAPAPSEDDDEGE